MSEGWAATIQVAGIAIVSALGYFLIGLLFAERAAPKLFAKTKSVSEAEIKLALLLAWPLVLAAWLLVQTCKLLVTALSLLFLVAIKAATSDFFEERKPAKVEEIRVHVKARVCVESDEERLTRLYRERDAKSQEIFRLEQKIVEGRSLTPHRIRGDINLPN